MLNWTVRQFDSAFPAGRQKFPAKAEEFPAPLSREFAIDSCDYRSIRRANRSTRIAFRENSLQIPCLSGNSAPEQGSILTAHTASRSALPEILCVQPSFRPHFGPSRHQFRIQRRQVSGPSRRFRAIFSGRRLRSPDLPSDCLGVKPSTRRCSDQDAGNSQRTMRSRVRCLG